ncbi:MAG: [FeFe] hydrogenase H-cluster radical SAM maturase HydE [Planctomycetes bacterium]|nr:[FeFe] hydrogenase H-cluster radical SAM maturase HydE [Planctomycetota bacterium]
MKYDSIDFDNIDKIEMQKILSISSKNELEKLYRAAHKIKHDNVGKKLYLRGLIEFSNLCQKDCLYCGLRCSNKTVNRYELTTEDILQAVEIAHKYKLGSLVLQSGERSDRKFINWVTEILSTIREKYNDEFHITLSSGEQNYKTYKKWFDAGADRYLLRIETSNRELYSKIHPHNSMHSYDRRLECLKFLRNIGYQVGSGIMIAMPFQTLDILAEDLMYLKELDVDMVGMGPYLEHAQAPLAQYVNSIPTINERLELAMKCIAALRILMPDINIAAATALETISEDGKISALLAGANVIMPNITPSHREDYFLYENKPVNYNNFVTELRMLEEKVSNIGESIAFGNWGDTLHYIKRKGGNEN